MSRTGRVIPSTYLWDTAMPRLLKLESECTMISTVQIDALKQLHQDHIAHTFLFTTRVLEQYRRITDAQVEVLHSVLRNFSTAAPIDGVDPLILARNAMGQITRALVNPNGHSSTYIGETAAAYAEIMRLIVDYANDSFVGASRTRDEIGPFGRGLSTSLQDAWTSSFVEAFKGAVSLMTGAVVTRSADVADKPDAAAPGATTSHTRKSR